MGINVPDVFDSREEHPLMSTAQDHLYKIIIGILTHIYLINPVTHPLTLYI